MPIMPGMQGDAGLTVDESHTPGAPGGSNLPTLGLPALIALIERAAANAIRRGLDDGEVTVGTNIEVRYHTPVPIGKHVRAEAVVTAIEGRTVQFDVRATESTAAIAEGRHERGVVNREEYVWRAARRGVS